MANILFYTSVGLAVGSFLLFGWQVIALGPVEIQDSHLG